MGNDDGEINARNVLEQYLDAFEQRKQRGVRLDQCDGCIRTDIRAHDPPSRCKCIVNMEEQSFSRADAI